MKNIILNYFQPIHNPTFVKLFLTILPLLTGFIVVILNSDFLDPKSDFMLIAWNPGQELLTTGSIYADYPYPAWTVVVMLPFVLWAPKTAMILWFLFNLVMLAASLALFITMLEQDISLIFLGLVVVLFSMFMPVLTSIFIGQLTIFSLLILALTVRLFLQQSWTWLGVVLGLSFIKPQVTILLTGLLLLWAIWQRRWQTLLGFGAVIVFLVGISLPAIDSTRQIIGGGITSHLDTYIQYTSTLWGLFLSLGISWFVPLVISLLLMVWLCWNWLPFVRGLETSPERTFFLFSAAVMVNLMVVPYSWMHNLALLLLPICYCLSQALKLNGRVRSAWLALLFFVVHPLVIGIFVVFDKREFPQTYQIIPVIFLFVMMFFLESQMKLRNS